MNGLSKSEEQSKFTDKKQIIEASCYAVCPQPANGEQMNELSFRLKSAFPSLSQQFILELMRMADRDRIPFERLKDSIEHTIRTHRYPNLTIADILDFDVKVRMYTYTHILRTEGKFDEETRAMYRKYKTTAEGKMLYVRTDEIEALPERFRSLAERRIAATEEELRKKKV